MLDLGIKRMGDLAIVECKGRVVRSEAAFKLRKAVLCLGDPRIIILDLSKVSAIEGGGLGMLMFLHKWAGDHDMQLKLFNPTKSVRERLQLVSSIGVLKIASLHEIRFLLANADRHFGIAA
ncbi:MAG: STAS domain-containing protein [Candidatus Sulfotelmatobacter sp.]